MMVNVQIHCVKQATKTSRPSYQRCIKYSGLKYKYFKLVQVQVPSTTCPLATR